MVPRPNIRGITEIMVGRILMFMWSLGPYIEDTFLASQFLHDLSDRMFALRKVQVPDDPVGIASPN